MAIFRNIIFTESEQNMTYVVTKACIGCKDTSCVTVCPVDSFHEGPDMLYINPDVCIVCDGCVVECPVDAIFHEEDVPENSKSDIELNAQMSLVYPVITERRPD